MSMEQARQIGVVVSSEMSRRFTPIIARRADHFARDAGMEWVIGKAEDLKRPRPAEIISGIHFRPMKANGFQREIEEIIPQVGEIVGRSETQTVVEPYLSFHTDLLASMDESEIDPYLRQLNDLASQHNVMVLFENTTPRVDGANRDWCYDLGAFRKRFSAIWESCPNIRVNLDLAHLGLTSEIPYQVLHKFYLAATRGIPTENILGEMTDKEKKVYDDFSYIIGKTKVLHWSRTRGKPMLKRWDFRATQTIARRLPKSQAESLHNKVYSIFDNLSYAHFSIISNPRLFYELLSLLDYFGYRGLYVIESHGAMQRIREWQEPFVEELEALRIIVTGFLGESKPALKMLADG